MFVLLMPLHPGLRWWFCSVLLFAGTAGGCSVSTGMLRCVAEVQKQLGSGHHKCRTTATTNR
jgi:hypothetical protein